jgi:hypothetical protein
MREQEKVYVPELTDSRWVFAALGLFFLGLALVRQEWQPALMGLGFLLFSALAFKAQAWFQRRYDEEHPGGVDLREIEKLRNDPHVSEDELRSRATPWDPNETWIDEANDYIMRLRDGHGRPLEAPAGAEADWDQMADIESSLIGRLTAMIFGAHPDARWTTEIRPKVEDPSWRRRWPEQARTVDGSMRLIESVNP